MNYGKAWAIVKGILSSDYNLAEKVEAIKIVSDFETLNSLKKDDLQACLRFLFATFDFAGAVKEEQDG